MVAGYYDPPSGGEGVLNIIRFEGGERLQTLKPAAGIEPRTIRWTPDGLALTYVAASGRQVNIWAQAVRGGTPRPLGDFLADVIWGFDWSKDNRLVVARGSIDQDIVLIEAKK
jgi:hypothetical protein